MEKAVSCAACKKVLSAGIFVFWCSAVWASFSNGTFSCKILRTTEGLASYALPKPLRPKSWCEIASGRFLENERTSNAIFLHVLPLWDNNLGTYRAPYVCYMVCYSRRAPTGKMCVKFHRESFVRPWIIGAPKIKSLRCLKSEWKYPAPLGTRVLSRKEGPSGAISLFSSIDNSWNVWIFWTYTQNHGELRPTNLHAWIVDEVH